MRRARRGRKARRRVTVGRSPRGGGRATCSSWLFRCSRWSRSRSMSHRGMSSRLRRTASSWRQAPRAARTRNTARSTSENLAQYGVTLELRADARRRREFRAAARRPGRRRVRPGGRRRAVARRQRRAARRFARRALLRADVDIPGRRSAAGRQARGARRKPDGRRRRGQRHAIARVATAAGKAASMEEARSFCRIGGEEMFSALDAGEVDVVFQVAGIEAPIVRASSCAGAT